jgi:ABC-2 type transport system ATP-binding protein
MSDDIAIKVEGVSKTFRLPHEKNNSVKGAVINFYRTQRTYEKQEALKDVSFEVKKGEFFGIVGRNGSGKSTLLKMLAGIYSPSKGTITVNGKLTPFIELGVGFNPELTGRENVFLNGALLGFNRKEMNKMYKDIVDFAELEKFMDQKLKNYSSGMQVRLAFSIAIRATSDILILDEVLAVGDIAFQKKCLDYFYQLKKDKRTVILVSHDMEAVEKHCTRAALINNGVLRDVGNPKDISAQYRLLNLPKAKELEGTGPLTLFTDVTIDSVTINGNNQAVVSQDQALSVEVLYTPKKTQTYIASVSISQIEGQHIAYYDSRHISKKMKCEKRRQYKVTCSFSAKQFLKGAYQIEVDLRDKNDIYLARKSEAAQFSITGSDKAKAGVFDLDGQWQIKKIGD